MVVVAVVNPSQEPSHGLSCTAVDGARQIGLRYDGAEAAIPSVKYIQDAVGLLRR